MVKAQKRKDATKEERLDDFRALEQEFQDLQNLMEEQRNTASKKWTMQKRLLTETLKNIEYIRRNAIRTKSDNKKERIWLNYFKCDGLPNNFQPAEVLNYISKWNYTMKEKLGSGEDWSLARNELSILTQDDSTPDLTLIRLKESRVDDGEVVVKQIQSIEYILNGLRKTVHLESARFSKQDKIALRIYRNEIEKNMQKSIDLYTHNLLKNMERDMDPVEKIVEEEGDMYPMKSNRFREAKPVKKVVDVTLLEHNFSHELFSFHLWALRDVPQPPRTSRDRFTIPLASFGGEATFPYSPEMKKLAFRSYWTQYDHYSVHCPNYTLADPPLPVVDLYTALTEEWKQREFIDQQKFNELVLKKTQHEETMRTLHEEEDKKAKSQKSDLYDEKKKEKKKKGTKEKAKKLVKFTLGDFNQYDPNAEFISKEDAEYTTKLNNMYPDPKFKIKGDINLRSHQIMGGVFHFEFLAKPIKRADQFLMQMNQMHTLPSDIINFQTIRLYDIKTLPSFYSATTEGSHASVQSKLRSSSIPGTPSRRSFIDILKESISKPPKHKASTAPVEDPFTKKGTKGSLKGLLRQSESAMSGSSKVTFDGSKLLSEAVPDDLVRVEYKLRLPPHIMWWTPPTVCYWEPWEYSEEFRNLSEKEQEVYRNYDKYLESLHKRLFKIKPRPKPTEKDIPDFEMQKIPKSVDFKEICKEYILPALPYNYQTYIDIVVEKKLEESTKRRQRIQMGLADSADENINEKAPTRPQADPSPPTPLFIPRERFNPKVNVITIQKKYVEFEPEITVKDMEESKDLDRGPSNVSAEDYRPPDILFSEFYKQITEQSAREESIIPQIDSRRDSRVRGSSEDAVSVTISQHSMKKAVKRRSKRPKAKTTTEKSKQFAEERDTNLKEQNYDDDGGGQEGSEFRGSLKYGQTVHPKGRWCTRRISHQKYDKETKTITFFSPCFGAFALAVPRYLHMPYKSWTMNPHHGKFRHITFQLTTPWLSLEIHVNAEGFTVHFPPKTQLPIEPPAKPLPLFDFKQLLCNMGLNIFPDRDAACYVENISEKHLAMEYHTYYCMACFCRTFRFKHSPWNRLSNHRYAVINIQDALESRTIERAPFDVLILPNECFRVKVKEECSMNLDNVNLTYLPDPPGQEFQPDLYFLLKSTVADVNLKDADEATLNLTNNVVQLLWNIRPLSFS